MLGTALAYMAAAFFMPKISRAAAMQAGGPGLRGCDWVGAPACWASAGPLDKANPSARQAAGKVLKTLFIPLLPGICGASAAQQREFRRRPLVRPRSQNS